MIKPQNTFIGPTNLLLVPLVANLLQKKLKKANDLAL